MRTGTELQDHEARALIAAQMLIEHPYSRLSLSDREKFHTGFLSVAINQLGSDFANSFFTGFDISFPQGIWSDCEHRSIDLIIREGNPATFGTIVGGKNLVQSPPLAIVEMKFKTLVSDKQLAKYAKRYPTVKSRYLVGLQEPIFESDHKHGFRFLPLPRRVIDTLSDFENAIHEDYQPLFKLWVDYLTHIDTIQGFFQKAHTLAISIELKHLLISAKIQGIFESYRLSTVARELFDITDNTSFTWHPEFGNTHGNALLGYSIYRKATPLNLNFGLQWQGNIIKLYIETRERKNDLRDKTLKAIASELRGCLDCGHLCPRIDRENPKLNRTGRFRSVTLNDWPIYGDLTKRSGELSTLLGRLEDFKDRLGNLQPLE